MFAAMESEIQVNMIWSNAQKRGGTGEGGGEAKGNSINRN